MTTMLIKEPAVVMRAGPAKTTDVAVSGHAAGPIGGAVTGLPRVWLRLEGLTGLAAGVAIYLAGGGSLLWILPLFLAVDISMVGYLGGPRLGAVLYDLAHNWAIGLAVLGASVVLASTPLLLAGAILVAHVGLDRLAGYGLKYPTAFADTHLGSLRR